MCGRSEGSLALNKCFWCGATNEKDRHTCGQCGRDLQWSSFFKALLKPSVGCLLGKDEPGVAVRPTSRPLVRI